jgi:hypothetical protein
MNPWTKAWREYHSRLRFSKRPHPKLMALVPPGQHGQESAYRESFRRPTISPESSATQVLAALFAKEKRIGDRFAPGTCVVWI